MKFRFCGDGDCPDWVLAQIHSTLSKIVSIKFGLLAQIVAEHIKNEDIPEDKLKDLTGSNADGDFAKSAISCLRFLLTSAARNNTSETTFCEELQQLGLPKEHSHILSRIMSDKLQNLHKHLLLDSLYINLLKDFTSNLIESTNDQIILNISIGNEIVCGREKSTSYSVKVRDIDLTVLLSELKVVNDAMKNYNYQKKYADL